MFEAVKGAVNLSTTESEQLQKTWHTFYTKSMPTDLIELEPIQRNITAHEAASPATELALALS